MKTSGMYKWIALALVWGAAFFQQGLRQVYGATLPGVAGSLGVSSVEIGLVGTVFTFVYGITVISAGYLSDLLSRKWVLCAGVLLFSVGGFGSALASSVGALILTYGILNGLGQPLVFPPGMSLLAQLHDERTKATALSLLQSAVYVGIIFGAVGAGHLADLGENGWRNAYRYVGLAGLVWVVVMAVLLKDTRPVAAAAANVTGVSLGEALRSVASKPSALLYGAYLIILNSVTIGFTVWTPTLIKDMFPEFSLRTAAFHAIVWMYLGSILGVMVGGRVGDRWSKRWHTVRMDVLAIGVAGCGVAWLLVARVSGLAAVGSALAMAGFFRGVLDSNLNVGFFDVIDSRYHASALGFMLGLSYVFGSITPIGLGWMRESFSLRAGVQTFPFCYLAALALIVFSRCRYYLKDREATQKQERKR